MTRLFRKASGGPDSTTRTGGKYLAPSFFMLLLCTGLLLINGSTSAQTRDHLTDQETDLVRFHQELDKRIEVFIRAMDRRFAIINGKVPPAEKKLVKDEPEWGEVPKGTHAQLLGDIAGILDEAITNIDDVNRRDARNPLISRSLRKLTSTAQGYLTQLAALQKQTKDPDELDAIERVATQANEIIDVGSKLPPPVPEADKKKKP